MRGEPVSPGTGFLSWDHGLLGHCKKRTRHCLQRPSSRFPLAGVSSCKTHWVYFILFYFILFYFILFYFILFYFIYFNVLF